jgi:hypothetical protein
MAEVLPRARQNGTYVSSGTMSLMTTFSFEEVEMDVDMMDRRGLALE